MMNMRSYIFTEKERKMLKKWLNEDLKLNGFAVLKHRIRRTYDRLREDYKLLEAAINKLKG